MLNMEVRFMKQYLAKSNPKETIQVHTDNLLNNYNTLKKIYPNLNIDWDILEKSCLYHDLGKINKKFQDKINNIRRHNDEIPHGILSLLFIDFEELEDEGYSEDDIKVLFHSIGYHHERDLKYTTIELEREIELIEKESKDFKYDRIDNIFVNDYIEEQFFIKNKRIYGKNNEKLFFKYVLTKGLLNRLDYAASGYIDVEKENNFLLNDLENNLLKSFKKESSDSEPEWNDLQKCMMENRDKNLVVTAQTGMGKTEAGLLWIGDNKGFFTLPLKTAINAIYKRIVEKVVVKDYEDKVGLLHSDIKREYLINKDEIDFDEYYNKTRQLSLPLTICTIDQIFDFVYRYRGFESKFATLSYSKVVVDEVQMYSPDLLAYLIVGLYYIDKIGGKFAVLTATLPQIFVELLGKENVKFEKLKPFTNDKIRHSLKVKHEKLNTDFIKEKYEGNKVLVICNTVKEAQRVYKELHNDEDFTDNVNLFHSGFIRRDRKNKEDNILKFGNKYNTCKGVWITTQVVEASLDIDFDVLITELSDLNGLFQRMGRCYRDRDWEDEGYNCYVFDGGERKTTGIGNVIDADIFEFSKKTLKDEKIDGVVKEEQKIRLVNDVYTLEKLKGTKYYEELVKAINYVKLIESYEKSHDEIKRIFRNIESKKVIPKSIYDGNKDTINSYIKTINTKYEDNMTKEDRKELKMKKAQARIDIEDLTLNIPLYRADKLLLSGLEISKYETVEIFECRYSEKTGIEYIKKDDLEEKEKFVEDKFF